VSVGDGLVWRSPTPEDAQTLGRLNHRAWVDAYSHLLPDDWFEHWTVDDAIAKWQRILASPVPEGLVRMAVFDEVGAAVAWVVAGPTQTEEGIEPARPLGLWSIYVARDHHGGGLPRALAEWALGDAPAELWVFDGNPRAEAFYRKLGFERDGVEAPHLETGLPGIRMVRGG
jgi:GNAT superfamily N-acetyltransferase